MGRAVVIGIAGGTASGKSTLACALATALDAWPAPLRVAVIAMDRYFKRGAAVPRFFSPSRKEWLPDHNRPDTADLPRLCADVDALLAAEEHDVIVIEGLMTLHDDAVRARCDLKVFVETDDDVRLARRIERALANDANATIAGIVGYYFESAHRGHHAWVLPSRRHADLIVPGGRDFGPAVEALAAWARTRCDLPRTDGAVAARKSDSRSA